MKNIKLTANPQPRTNIKEGFQSLPKAKKLIIFVLLTIPETKRPIPKTRPTRKRTNWSLYKNEFVSFSLIGELSLSIGIES